MRLWIAAWLVLAGAVSCAHTTAAAFAAEEAQHASCLPYCSLSSVRPFYGDITSSGGLKAALAARSFSKEVILMLSDAHRLDSSLSAVSNLKRLGFGHILFVSTDPLTCRAVGGCGCAGGQLLLKGGCYCLHEDPTRSSSSSSSHPSHHNHHAPNTPLIPGGAFRAGPGVRVAGAAVRAWRLVATDADVSRKGARDAKVRRGA